MSQAAGAFTLAEQDLQGQARLIGERLAASEATPEQAEADVPDA